MDPQASTFKGQITGPPVTSGPKMSIKWQGKTALTDVLVNYLTTHPSDCRILFYLEGKKKMADAEDNPMGKDKGHIYSAITGLIFADYIKYGTTYHQNLKKFCNSVSNQISGTKYEKHKGRFAAMGAGIMPHDGQSVQNLLALIHMDFPWFSDLDSIWHNNPSMAAKAYLSQPGVDHASALYVLIQLHGRAGPSMLAAQSSHAYLPPSAYPPLTSSINEQLNTSVPLTSSINVQSNMNVPLTSSINKQLNMNVPQRLPKMPDLPPSASYLPSNTYLPVMSTSYKSLFFSEL
ncbi:hypothetical protein BDR06DRAFT_1014126 [Suillus hirtellus]|nr:hypothetical protein BDR06DRAFT_1014126 [Suillus hirtellus]